MTRIKYNLDEGYIPHGKLIQFNCSMGQTLSLLVFRGARCNFLFCRRPQCEEADHGNRTEYQSDDRPKKINSMIAKLTIAATSTIDGSPHGDRGPTRGNTAR